MPSPFNIDHSIEKFREFLVPQGPLKEFVAQNPLRGFLNLEFHDALRRAAATWGAWTYLPLGFYRASYADGEISETALARSLEWNIEDSGARERARSDLFEYPEGASKKPPSLAETGLRSQWSKLAGVSVAEKSSPVVFRLLGAYLDQGIAIWRMPATTKGLIPAVRDMLKGSFIGFYPFSQPIALQLIHLPIDELITTALKRLVGREDFYERYILDILMTTPGWSSTVDFIEKNPDALVLRKNISLKEILALNLILDAAFLEIASGSNFPSLAALGAESKTPPMDVPQHVSRIDFIKLIWHEAWEWTFYEKSLSLITKLRSQSQPREHVTIQALFCIDDRECSLRRYLEAEDKGVETFGLPGFFGVDFMYQCATDVSPARLAPIVIKPKHLITSKFTHSQKRVRQSRSEHFALGKHTHTILRGWLITQALGLSAAIRLALSIFKPHMTQATASSLSRVNEHITMNLERPLNEGVAADGYFHGFTTIEMAEKLQIQLESIGLAKSFAPLVVVMAHGSSSTNNTHFSAYDCGACSGKPGSPNARAFVKMANNPNVRQELAKRGIIIPDTTTFVAALHDTTRDEVKFFDLRDIEDSARAQVGTFKKILLKALKRNAKERCRRFELVNPKISETAALAEVQRRSVAIFEPRPELTHAGNAMAIVGRRSLTAGGFFDRRAFLHSYDPIIDPSGERLKGVLAAVIPVCGGINLNYYFSKLDNEVYGASTKLPHNIIGLIGVCSGVEGDIQTGLPRQMIEFHDPIRLQLVIEQRHEVIEKVLDSEPKLAVWIHNNWIRLMCIHPQSGEISIYRQGKFVNLPTHSLPVVGDKNNFEDCYEGSSANCPLVIVKEALHHGD